VTRKCHSERSEESGQRKRDSSRRCAAFRITAKLSL